MHGSLHPEGSVKSTKLKLTWLPNLKSELVKLKLIEYDYLITKKKVEENDSIESLANDHSVSFHFLKLFLVSILMFNVILVTSLILK